MKKSKNFLSIVALLALALMVFAVVGIYSEPVAAHTSSHSVRAYHTNITRAFNGVVTPLLFCSERWDTSGMHTIFCNNLAAELIAPATGYYKITGHVSWQGNANGMRVLTIRTGTVAVPGKFIASQQTPGNSVGTDQSVSTVYKLLQNTPVTLWVYQNSGSDLVINPFSEYSPEFTMTYLGP